MTIFALQYELCLFVFPIKVSMNESFTLICILDNQNRYWGTRIGIGMLLFVVDDFHKDLFKILEIILFQETLNIYFSFHERSNL